MKSFIYISSNDKRFRKNVRQTKHSLITKFGVDKCPLTMYNIRIKMVIQLAISTALMDYFIKKITFHCGSTSQTYLWYKRSSAREHFIFFLLLTHPSLISVQDLLVSRISSFFNGSERLHPMITKAKLHANDKEERSLNRNELAIERNEIGKKVDKHKCSCLKSKKS